MARTSPVPTATPGTPARRPPSTRFQGSKRRHLTWLTHVLGALEFDSATDLMCGTSSVAYALKTAGKRVHANDVLHAGHLTAVALIENGATRLSEAAVAALVAPSEPARAGFITEAYDGVFYLPEENAYLDGIVGRIGALPTRYERAIAMHALFQACLMKRPFNLFHRHNLHLRTAEVARSFGNKRTWDRPFAELIRAAVAELHAAIFDNGRPNVATRADAFDVSVDADLVYLDPPYLRASGASFRYGDAYHFLEGLARYDEWPGRLDRSRRHRPFRAEPTTFDDPRRGPEALLELLGRFAALRHVVVSYREEGVPTIAAIERRLRDQGRAVQVHTTPKRFALARSDSGEVLLVGTLVGTRGALRP
jgi:adenine-specific DNA-methyltransferase